MMMPSTRSLIAITLAAAAGCNSHQADKPDDKPADGAQTLSECPVTVAISTGWLEFAAKGSSAELTLPPGTVEVEVPEGQNWRLPGGSFAIRLSPLAGDSQSVERPPPWCITEVAGRQTEVRYFFGDATFGRRGYLTAEVPISGDTTMEIIASTYDSAGVDTLIAVLRALKF